MFKGSTGTIRDDAGMDAPVLRPSDLPPDAPPALKTAVALVHGGTVRGWLWRSLTVALGMSSAASLLGQRRWQVVLAIFAACLAASAGFRVLFAYLIRKRYREMLVDACRNAGLCSSCGYAIGGIAADPACLRQCPECGHRWRVPKGPKQSIEA